MAKSALSELKIINQQYRKACELWKALVQNLKVAAEEIPNLPAPEISEDGHRVSYCWTQTEVYCLFSFGNDGATLDYGYKEEDLAGRPQYFIVTTDYFDEFGNVRKEKDQPTSSYNITHRADLDGFFFSRLLEALQSAFNHNPHDYRY